MARRALVAVLAALMLAPLPAVACRQALALGLDVSGSVDAVEYRMQLDGLAEALADPDVAAHILAMPEAPVYLAVFEWSATAYQRVIVGWTALASQAVLADVAASLRARRRMPAPEVTGLGGAMAFGFELLARAPACAQATLDISGDGKNNDWPEPRHVRRGGQMAGVTVNALVIGQDQMRGDTVRQDNVADLSTYFRENVISGPGAFVEIAVGYTDYATAMRRKLLRELASVAIGSDRQRPPPRNYRAELFRVAQYWPQPGARQ